MRKNSIKNTRINGEVQKELSRIISREIKDPRISPMTSVVAVEVAPDLKQCKAYIIEDKYSHSESFQCKCQPFRHYTAKECMPCFGNRPRNRKR